MAKTIVSDLVGQVFGRLTVLEKLPKGQHNQILYRCLCECGKEAKTTFSKLNSGHTQSCGCLKEEVLLARNVKHGMRHTPTYAVYVVMKQRCTNPKDRSYCNYGERGINVSEKWLESFENFFADMGEAPKGKSLERLNNEIGYCKENCAWVGRKQQARNTRRNRYLEFQGETKTLAEWAEILEVNADVVRGRIDRSGWSVEKALSTPIDRKVISHSMIQKIVELRENGLTFKEISDRVGCDNSYARKLYLKHRASTTSCMI